MKLHFYRLCGTSMYSKVLASNVEQNFWKTTALEGAFQCYREHFTFIAFCTEILHLIISLILDLKKYINYFVIDYCNTAYAFNLLFVIQTGVSYIHINSFSLLQSNYMFCTFFELLFYAIFAHKHQKREVGTGKGVSLLDSPLLCIEAVHVSSEALKSFIFVFSWKQNETKTIGVSM